MHVICQNVNKQKKYTIEISQLLLPNFCIEYTGSTKLNHIVNFNSS